MILITSKIVILVIITFLEGGRVLSSKPTLCVYFKIDKLLALEMVSYCVPLTTRRCYLLAIGIMWSLVNGPTIKLLHRLDLALKHGQVMAIHSL